MNPRERTVHHYELQIRSYMTGKTTIQSPSCSKFIDVMEAIDLMKPVGSILGSNHAKSVTLADWRFNKKQGVCYFLLNMNDITKSDVALRDRTTKALRMAGKKPHEGIETSSYVAMKFDPNNRTAKVVMTMGAAITIDYVEKIIRSLIEELKKQNTHNHLFEFPHPSGTVKNGIPLKYSVQYALDWMVEKSEYLNKVLQSGTLEGVELIHEGSHRFDSNGNFLRERTAIEIKPTKHVSLSELKTAISEYMSGGNKIESAKISFKDANGEPKTTSMAINALNDAFVRKTRISFKTDVTDQDAKFSNTILIPLLKLL